MEFALPVLYCSSSQFTVAWSATLATNTSGSQLKLNLSVVGTILLIFGTESSILALISHTLQWSSPIGLLFIDFFVYK